MRLFDSHAHYFDHRFDEIGGADGILQSEVFGKDVARVINVGTNCDNASRCLEQAARYEGMYAALGIHPEDARYLEGTPEENLARLESLLGDKENRREKKIVAIGEIGFDYHWEGYDSALQKKYFEAQMRLAERLELPVIIHDLLHDLVYLVNDYIIDRVKKPVEGRSADP